MSSTITFTRAAYVGMGAATARMHAGRPASQASSSAAYVRTSSRGSRALTWTDIDVNIETYCVGCNGLGRWSVRGHHQTDDHRRSN
jgi:hypothetical protein